MMHPTEWPLRVIPRRSPPLWLALAITIVALAVAMSLRGLLLGLQHTGGLGSTTLPALIVICLYAGPRFGWAALLFTMLFGSGLFPVVQPSGASHGAVIAMFALSGAITLIFSAALREALLRLDEASVAREHARKASADSEARFRVLADSAPILMWVSRADGTREFVNRTYLEWLGASYEDALVFDWRKILHEEDLGRILQEQVAGEGSRQLFTLEARYRVASGEYRWIRSVSQPRYTPEGAFDGFIGVGYDITDAKRAETDLKRINELLAERIEAALADRDRAEDALRRAQKLEAVGQLTGGVAHDFNNLLTVVIGALDMIQRHPADAARRDRMIEAALGAARRGERLTQQLLAFSRRQALKPEPVRVDALLAEAEPLLRRAVGESVALTIAPASHGAVVNLDPAQFEAAVMNLVVNARDATPPGGMIRVETRRCRVDAGEVEELEPGDYLCVGVHDTGSGMDAATAARVFEPFFTTKAPGKGTGLGLSQVYGFARQSGGSAVVDSEPGKGATVHLYLPLSDAPVAQPEEPAAPQPERGPGLRVLLAEDDAQVGELVEALLADLGHSIVRRPDAAAALQVLAAGIEVDLLLTDLIMPGDMNGVDLAREAVRLRPGLPVILSSGYTGEALDPVDGAPWPLLRKPYGSDQLAQAIADVLPDASRA
ncbi:ATP-binding protein [Phenylobacterium sp. VNQ135]|uniref:hybrid sensor histidine kinase/response regulator n=1 Tax=Phenylobacterium sp. VNQ135 TaxID=3400922 RepID=UPI003C0F77E4